MAQLLPRINVTAVQSKLDFQQRSQLFQLCDCVADGHVLPLLICLTNQCVWFKTEERWLRIQISHLHLLVKVVVEGVPLLNTLEKVIPGLERMFAQVPSQVPMQRQFLRTRSMQHSLLTTKGECDPSSIIHCYLCV